MHKTTVQYSATDRALPRQVGSKNSCRVLTHRPMRLVSLSFSLWRVLTSYSLMNYRHWISAPVERCLHLCLQENTTIN